MEKKLAVEVIWSKSGTIIGYSEVNGDSLSRMYKEDGTFVWVQYANDETKKRILFQSQILTNF